jgi:hypothetical protein
MYKNFRHITNYVSSQNNIRIPFNIPPEFLYAIILIFIFIIPLSFRVFADSQIRYPNKGENLIVNSDYRNWQNPQNICNNNSAYARVYFHYASETQSNYLSRSDYRFNIPAEAIIEGIERSTNIFYQYNHSRPCQRPANFSYYISKL